MIESIKKTLKEKNYEFFDVSKPYNLNIIGVRSLNKVSNKFDDKLILIYNDGKEVHNLAFQITTDPGKYYLNNPINNKGTAILAPGQYKGAYAIGMHQGKYEALVQVKSVKVFRDNDRDDILDFDVPTDIGLFGINIHRSNPYRDQETVDGHSAGCQVFKRVADFNTFIAICKKSIKLYGNLLTYTLIEEKDIK